MKPEEIQHDPGANSRSRCGHILGQYVHSVLIIALAVAMGSPSAEAARLKAGDLLVKDLFRYGSPISGQVLTRTGPLSADLSLWFTNPDGDFFDGFAVDKFGRILGHNLNSEPARIFAFDPSSGVRETIATIHGQRIPSIGLPLAPMIVALADGSVVVPTLLAEGPNDAIRLIRVHPTTGEIQLVAEICPVVAFNEPIATPITLDADGSIVFVCPDGGLVGRVGIESGVVEEIAAIGSQAPTGLVVDPISGLIVASYIGGPVTSIDPTTGLTTTLLTGGAGGGIGLDPLMPGRFIIGLRSYDPTTGIFEDFTGDIPSGIDNVITVQARCNDRFDNDEDGKIDMADPDCLDPHQDFEARGCGSGFEQASVLVAPLIWVVGRRRVRRRMVERTDV